jgi:zona occludens toxin (predicted ATPase)
MRREFVVVLAALAIALVAYLVLKSPEETVVNAPAPAPQSTAATPAPATPPATTPPAATPPATPPAEAPKQP